MNPTSAPSTGERLRETIVKAALAKLRLTMLTDHLQKVGWDEDIADQLVGHVRRASGLIYPRADAAKEKKRDEFLDSLVEHLRSKGSADAVDRLDAAILQLAVAEDGYRRILTTLAACEISKLAPDVRMSAVLHRAAEQHRLLDVETTAAIARQRYKLPQSLSLRDSRGRPVSPDGIIDALVSGVGATLVMEAYNSGWFDGDIVVIPSLPEVGAAERFQAGSNEVLAQAWKLWRRTEERARFTGAPIALLAAPHLPDDVPPQAARAYELQAEAGEDWLNFAAQLRMNDIHGQSYAELLYERGTEALVGDLASGVPLPPDGYVSLEEAAALGQLSETLGYAVKDDQDRIEGLRILEWLRGFAVLGALGVRQLEGARHGADQRLGVFSREEVAQWLGHGGLAPSEAEIFIDQSTFRRTSRDLFDAPLVRMQSGHLLLFGPAVLGHNPGSVLLSVFGSKHVEFPRKGRAFETRVMDLFEENGLKPRSFKTSRDGAEFEFDVVVPWGDWLFLFECKNRSLPGDNPIQAYHFAQESRAHAKQVRRLAEALERWPDILQAEFGEDLSSKQIVCCVLNNLPYARQGSQDGVYFFDWSALSRFFGSGQLSLKTFLTFGGGEKRVHRIGTLRVWAGDAPEPGDLLAQLADPVQLKVLRHHTRRERLVFGLDPQTVAVAPEFVREDVTALSLADMAGIPRRKVMNELDKQRRKARKSRQRAKRDARLGGR